MPKIENRENQSRKHENRKDCLTGLTRHFYGGQAGQTGSIFCFCGRKAEGVDLV
jgi:hypothetical protein